MKQWIALVLVLLMTGAALADEGWYCAACDRMVTSNFCSGCGASRPVENQCAACGHVGESGRTYRFCPRCGAAMTADAPAPTAAPTEKPNSDDLILTLAGEGKAYPLGSMKMLLTTYPDGSRDALPISLSAGSDWSVKALLFVTGNAVEGVMDVQLALFDGEELLWQQDIPAVDFNATFGQKLLGEFSLAGVLTHSGDYMMAVYVGGRLGTTTLLTVAP